MVVEEEEDLTAIEMVEVVEVEVEACVMPFKKENVNVGTRVVSLTVVVEEEEVEVNLFFLRFSFHVMILKEKLMTHDLTCHDSLFLPFFFTISITFLVVM